MADVVDMTQQSAPAPVYGSVPAVSEVDASAITFHGAPHNMVVGITFIMAGASAFVMGMTDVFFARAMAWIFVIWGVLFLLYDLLDWARSWTVTDEGLRIGIVTPLWKPHTLWEWANINRLDLVVKRYEPKPQDVVMQVYFTAPGDTVLYREDRVLSPDLARMIVERADLKATHAVNPASFSALPPDKKTYIWNKSGKFNTAM